MEPQRKFDKLIRAYERAESAGYYRVAGAEPCSVAILKQPFGDVPAGSKVLWVCGDRGFHSVGGVFGDALHCRARIRVIPVEEVLAVVLSALLSFFSTTALEGTGYVVAALVLAVFIGLGIVFDMIGVAVTAADPKPFHSMAAHKEKGAKAAIRLLQNANQVSSVCNDVVGDICGIVSGSTAAVIVTHLQRDLSTTSVLISIGATALISGITIGGKALGKTVAINQCTSVVYRVARIMHALHLSR